MGLESCNGNFAPVLGRDVTVDHFFNEFYCAAMLHSESYTSKKTVTNT
jgi:hypothetical protein